MSVPEHFHWETLGIRSEKHSVLPSFFGQLNHLKKGEIRRFATPFHNGAPVFAGDPTITHFDCLYLAIRFKAPG